MGTCFSFLSPSKDAEPLPIDTIFKLPSPTPTWPSGGGFAKGRIDLGGLEVCQVATFTKVWATQEGGQDNLGATFFNPSPLPAGFFSLGSYAQPNNKALFGWALAGRDTAGETQTQTLAKPTDYSLVWSSESSNIKQDGRGYLWLPVPPQGYKAVGHVVTASPDKPSVDEVRCVRSDLTDQCETDSSIWSNGGDGLTVYSLRPATRGPQALGVCVGTFIAQPKGATTDTSLPLACLKNKSSNLSSMPSLDQIQALLQAYSPFIYLHPDEPYLPSSVPWFFSNGALLYQKGSSTPTRIDPTGSNLPQGGSNDGAYWLDLPADDKEKERVKKGDITTAEPYVHVKPMLGATFTDLAMWVFYPFNGPARAKVGFVNIKLGKIGEHVGDWEHVTLRVSNFSGELSRVYFSEHSGGSWASASEVEFESGGGNRPVAYASLSGHAFYPKAGLVLQGSAGIGIRNDTAKGRRVDSGARFEVVAAEYLGAGAVAEPAWLEYYREWGPKIDYEVDKELKKVVRFLPGTIRKAVESLVNGLPDEVLGEEGPTGPKVKASWNGDEA